MGFEGSSATSSLVLRSTARSRGGAWSARSTLRAAGAIAARAGLGATALTARCSASRGATAPSPKCWYCRRPIFGRCPTRCPTTTRSSPSRSRRPARSWIRCRRSRGGERRSSATGGSGFVWFRPEGRGARRDAPRQTPRKLDLASRAGITTRLVSGGEEASGLAPFPLVVDATGSAAGLSMALALVEPRGTLVLKTTTHEVPKKSLARIVIDEITVVGSRCGRFEPALAALESRRVRPRVLIADRFPSSGAPKPSPAPARETRSRFCYKSVPNDDRLRRFARALATPRPGARAALLECPERGGTARAGIGPRLARLRFVGSARADGRARGAAGAPSIAPRRLCGIRARRSPRRCAGASSRAPA